MPKSSKLEAELAAVGGLRSDPHAEATSAALRKALGSNTALIVAKAASIVRDYELAAFETELAEAFDRFGRDPIKSDRGCRAKETVLEALYATDGGSAELFLAGLHCVQREATFGEPVDAAARTRGIAALGLVRTGHRHLYRELADVLADSEAETRRFAAQALVYAGGEEGVALLRLKVHLGDEDPDVSTECMAALLKLDPEHSFTFVGGFLHSKNMRVAESAALALGSSRDGGAFPILCSWWESTSDSELGTTGLLAIAMLRAPEALGFLYALVAKAAGPIARDALRALATYREDEEIRARTLKIAEERDDVDLESVAHKAFGQG